MSVLSAEMKFEIGQLVWLNNDTFGDGFLVSERSVVEDEGGPRLRYLLVANHAVIRDVPEILICGTKPERPRWESLSQEQGK